MKRLQSLVVIVGAVLLPRPAGAVVQAMTGPSERARILESSGSRAAAAPWRESEIYTLETISRPMFGEILRHHRKWRDAETVRETEERFHNEVTLPLAHARKLLAADLQAAARHPLAAAETRKLEQTVDQDMLPWAVLYPDRFFRYGLYRDMAAISDLLLRSGRTAQAVEVEARARECCARQYREITLPILHRLAGRMRARKEFEAAARCGLLAHHYERLAAEQQEEAARLRDRTKEVAEFLASGPATRWQATDPLLVRLRALRVAGSLLRGSADHKTPAERPAYYREALPAILQKRDAFALLSCLEENDSWVQSTARSHLETSARMGDLVTMQALVEHISTTSHERASETHHLLSLYAPPSRLPASFPAAQDRQVGDYWQRWWQSHLQPGLAGGFSVRRVGSNAAPDEVSGVIQSHKGGVYLLTVAGRQPVRGELDGELLTFTGDASGGGQVARLLLEPGEHVLQIRRQTAGLEPAQVRLLSLRGDEAGDLTVSHFARPADAPTAPAAAAVDERVWSVAPYALLGLCALLLLREETAAVLGVRRIALALGTRFHLANPVIGGRRVNVPPGY